MAKITAFLIALILLAPACVHAAVDRDFASWMQALQQQAVDEGISAATIHGALDAAFPDDRVVSFDKKQPETTITFDRYARNIVSPERIAEGRDNLRANAASLNMMAQRYGVPAQIIVALWGVESRFGKSQGKYEIVDSLITLAYEGRRADFFRRQLLDALHILDQEHIPASALRGSWAGAMGQCQFMPSTYLHYAVDADGDGHRDIWGNQNDVFASVANYLAAEGWQANMSWGFEVEPIDLPSSVSTGLDHPQSGAEWSKLGFARLDGRPVPEGLMLSLMQPDGSDGRAFLVTDNYRAIMRWNRSTYFATSIGLLADQL